jgi:hypothetical protein
MDWNKNDGIAPCPFLGQYPLLYSTNWSNKFSPPFDGWNYYTLIDIHTERGT